MLRLLAVGAFCFGIGSSHLQASLVISFSNGDQLEGGGVNSGAVYSDSMTGVTGMLTTRTFTNTSGAVDHSATLNPNSGSLGINSTGSDSASAFDHQESWTFDWDVESSFLGIDLGSFTGAQNETFTIRSSDWIGLSGVAPGDPGSVTYHSATGAFMLTDNGTADVFDLLALTGGGVNLDVSAGTDITIGYRNLAPMTQSAVVQSLTFSLSATAVPEPSSFALISVLAIFGMTRRRLRTHAIKSSVAAD